MLYNLDGSMRRYDYDLRFEKVGSIRAYFRDMGMPDIYQTVPKTVARLIAYSVKDAGSYTSYRRKEGKWLAYLGLDPKPYATKRSRRDTDDDGGCWDYPGSPYLSEEDDIY